MPRLGHDPRLATVDDVVVLVALVGAAIPERHRCGIRIGRADPKIGCPPIRATSQVRVGTTSATEPVVRLRGILGQVRRGRLRQRERQAHRCIVTFLSRTAAPSTIAIVRCRGEEVGEVRLDGQAGLE